MTEAAFLETYGSFDGRDLVITFDDDNSVRLQNVVPQGESNPELGDYTGVLTSGGDGGGGGTTDPEIPDGAYFGTEGDDNIWAGNIEIYGLGGNDTILGGSGDETIFGGDGDDIIIPDAGDDVITLGDGADRILHNSVSQEPGTILGHKTITDFELGIDSAEGASNKGQPGPAEFDGNDLIVTILPNFSPVFDFPTLTFENVYSEEIGDDPDDYLGLIFV